MELVKKIPQELHLLFVVQICPLFLNGTDVAPSPPEFLLHALAGCITTSMMLLASANDIQVDEVTVNVEGSINLNGFLGLDSCILKEYEQIKISIDVGGDLTSEEKETLLKFSKKITSL